MIRGRVQTFGLLFTSFSTKLQVGVDETSSRSDTLRAKECVLRICYRQRHARRTHYDHCAVDYL